MIIDIPYGKESISLDIPDGNILNVITGDTKVSAVSESNIISKALENPIASEKLFELAQGKKSAVVLVSDISRPCPTYKFLPALVKELNKGGIKDRDIKVILGLGIHRGHTETEKKKLLGETIYNRTKVLDSDPAKAKFIGTTKRGTPVEVFEKALGNDLLIATGNIEYHYFAGYSGGAKAVMPGICSRNSIQANHSMMLEEGSVAGNLTGNPVREDIEEAGRMAGIDFIFNVILDDYKNIIKAIAGKNNQAWIEGIKKYSTLYKKEVSTTADIVITSPGGFPKDINLYQSQKALENVKDIAINGGTIIIVACCKEGFGEDTFKSWMAGARDFNLISEKLKKKFVLGGHKAVAISKVCCQKEVILYSEFGESDTENMGFKKINDIQDYLNRRIKKDNKLKVIIVPTGRLVKLRDDSLKS